MTGNSGAHEGKFNATPGEEFEMTLAGVGAPCRGITRGIGAFMMLKGSAMLEINGESRALGADGLALLSNRDIYSIYSECRDAQNIALLLFVSDSFVERACPAMLNFRYDCGGAAGWGQEEQNKFFGAKRSLIRMMMALYKHGDGYALEVKRALMDFLHNVYMNFRAAPAAPAIAPRCEAGWIKEAVSFIHWNYRQGISLAAAAGNASVSPQYFSRRFKQKMGMGFWEYLNKIRLDSAVRDLLWTDDPILKIALNNGFSGSKPFTELFKKSYGQTPQSYRHRESGKKRVPLAPGRDAPNGLFWRVGERDGIDSLLKYAAIYDIRRDFGAASASEPIPVTLASPPKDAGISLPGKIFKIGRFAEALHDEIRGQLAEAQEKLRGDYIYFSGIFGEGTLPCPEGSFFKNYDRGRVFDFFFGLGLTPFVRVDLSAAPAGTLCDRRIEAEVSDFLDVMLESRPASRWKKGIRLEAVNSSRMGNDAFAEGFCEIHRAAKSRSPDIGVGLHSVASTRQEEWDAFRAKFRACAERGCVPDFLSITIDPSLEGYAAQDESSYAAFKNYGASQVSKALRACAEIDARKTPEIYVTEWNTLSGRTSFESSAFFRVALIASEILSYGKNVSAVAYWLNSKSKEKVTGKADAGVLALYFYGQVKRPPYYLLLLMDKLGHMAAHIGERLAVTSSKPGEYAVLMMNPCYFDPLYSVEEAYVSMEKVRVEARISGIPKGFYRIKSFFFEKKHSSAFDRLSRAGLMLTGDEDITLYLEHAILPEFNIFEERIDSVCSLAPELGYNGVALYLLKKISEG
ncbi:MAG: helix-turn-helix domain-containing protein [Synergistaceae bacterium]|jgi:AraC-like DNA-binding protein|nr:helix-turn-helix domain-containing protein [Synergistaceae bacterium]